VLPAERHQQITSAVRNGRVVSTEELALSLQVSVETIRRDLVILENRGVLRRVHGGAASTSVVRNEEPSFLERSALGSEAKAVIGRTAAALLRPGQTVVIDVGTTALEVARAIPSDFRGLVATCSLLAAAELAGRPHLEVLVSGGRLRPGDLACSNAQTIEFFTNLRPDVAFLGSGGVDVTDGLTDFHVDEVATRRVIIERATRSYVLAEASKIGRTAPHRVCGLSALAGVITDQEPPERFRAALDEVGAAVLAA
jgi:DeoR family transcriptional regulator, fructose operon transcriptional repressor